MRNVFHENKDDPSVKDQTAATDFRAGVFLGVAALFAPGLQYCWQIHTPCGASGKPIQYV